jgi:hypothetical protein
MQTADLFCSRSRHGIFVDGPTLARALKTCRKGSAIGFGPDPDPFPVAALRFREWLKTTGAEELELILTPRRLLVTARAPGLTLRAAFAQANAYDLLRPTSIRFRARRRFSASTAALPVAEPPAAPAYQPALFS